MPFDPYVYHPYSHGPNWAAAGIAPFFDLLLGFFIWVIGLGSPSKQTIDTVGAFFPAILGALTTIPVYFIGKELFNKKAGLLAAALIAILPGQFLLRSLLGFTDQHVAETLFSTLTMLFLIMAVKSSKQKGLSFESMYGKRWEVIGKPLMYSLLAGIALGCYLLSWVGGGLFIFIIFVYFIIQFIIDHLRAGSTNYLCIVGAFTFLVALLIIVGASGQYPGGNLQVASLVIGILVFLALGGLSAVMASRRVRQVYYPPVLAALAGIGWGALYLIYPSLLNSIVDKLRVFAPTIELRTISEAKGLPLSSIWDPTSPGWNAFTTGLPLALIALAIVLYMVVREGSADKTLLLVWSVIILVAMFSQNRFTYYFAVNVALLAAYLSWRILEFAGLGEASAGMEKEGDRSKKEQAGKEEARIGRKAKRKKTRAQVREPSMFAAKYLRTRFAYSVAAIVAVFFLAFYPNIGGAIDMASRNPEATDDWHYALVWMKENTPEPFGDPDFYYELYERPPAGEWYYPPESAYGVMSWWDYGYWITYIAHRIPNTMPGQANTKMAGLFFTSTDESYANWILDRMDSKYVIIDGLMATLKFYAMATHAGIAQSEFFEVYYTRNQAGQLTPVSLFYPEYYQSMCSRLYNFGGQRWDPFDDWIEDSYDDSTGDYREKIQAISYVEMRDANGDIYKEISGVERFTTYEMASIGSS
ncbi:MAG: oligosaccharyl transferase, archaeosortase A system-associated, partial [Dehalococcoidia bacterium]